MKIVKKTLAVAVLTSAFAISANAAEVTTSSDIKMTMSQILGMTTPSDIDFGTLNAYADASKEAGFCIYTNATSKSYTLSASSDNAFKLKDANNTTIDYKPYVVVGTLATELSSTPARLDGASASSSCSESSGSNVSLKIKILQNALENATAGDYTDKITLTAAAV